MKLDSFSEALVRGNAGLGMAAGLCGRIIRGTRPEDFLTLTDDPSRKLVMLMGPDGLEKLPGKTGYEMLIEIGYAADYITRKVVDEGNAFKLVVFPEGGPAKLATWDNVIDIVSATYPATASKLEQQRNALKVTPFDAIERQAGFSFAEVDKAGGTDPRFMTEERFVASGGSLWEARAFLHHSIHLRELFSGDGWTYTTAGERGLMEYIVPNRPIAELGESRLIEIPVTIPKSGGTKMNQRKLESYELAVPAFFDPTKVEEWRRPVKYADRFADAQAAQKQFGIKSPALDRSKIALMLIDNQLTFCNPDFELFVAGQSGRGAVEDTERVIDFIYRNVGVLSEIHETLDTHMAYQIFFATFLVDENGNHPNPAIATLIPASDIQSGKWRLDPRVAHAIGNNPGFYTAYQKQLSYYTEQLTNGGKYDLTIWPFHAMLGSLGHALPPALEEAVFYHSVLRGVQPKFHIKGENALTENYSVFAPEVMTRYDGTAIAQKNAALIKALIQNDVVIIAGQAKSHCVAWTIDDLLSTIRTMDESLVKKVYLLEDCTSSVVIPGIVDFSAQGDEAFRRFAAAGMNIVQSTDPIASWPGIDPALLA